MKTMDDDDKYYSLFSIDPFVLVGVEWTEGVESDRFGLLRFPYYQEHVLDFDPSITTDYRIIAKKCKILGISQRGAIVEWACLNLG